MNYITNKQANKNMAQSKREEKFNALFECIADAVFIADSKSKKLVDCNKNAEKLTGYSRKKLLSMQADKLHPKDLVKKTMNDFKKHAAGKLRIVETEVLTKSRKRIPVSINSSRIKFDGKPCVLGIFRNIVARKETEEKIRSSNEDYRTLFESTNDGMVFLDKKGTIKSVNIQTEFLFGHDSTKFVGKNISSLTKLFTPLSLARILKNFGLRMLGKGSPYYEVEVIGKNGEKKHVEIKATALKKNGKIVGDLAILRDITERRQAEDALSHEKELAEKYLNMAGVMITALDTKGNVTLINKKGCDILGYDKADIIGKNWFDNFVPKKITNSIKSVSRKLMPSKIKAIEFFETPVLTKNGDERLIAWHNKILTNKNNEIIGHLSSGEDITERKNAEKILKDSKTKLQLLYDSSSDAIMLLDEKGFFDCNSATLRLFGCATKEDFCGRHPADFSPPAQPDGTNSMRYAKNNIARALKKGSARFEQLHRRLDGTPFLAEVLLDELVLGGKKVLQARVFDITKRKKAEEEIKKSEEKFRLLAENSIDCIWILDTKLKFTYLSPSTKKILGFKPEQMIGTKLNSYFRKKEFLRVSALAAKAITNHTAFTFVVFETKMLNSKNEEVDLEVSGRVLLNSQSKSIGLQGISRDITERKQAEKALEQAHKNTKTILEKTQFGVTIIGKDKKIKWVNEHAGKMAGVKNVDVLLGKNCRDYFCPANQNECPILDKGQKVDNSERIFRRHDGKEIPIIKTVNEINFDNEDVLLETFIDITDRKKAEEELHASQLKYMQLFETMTSGVAIYEAVDNGNDFIFKDFNHAGEKIENIKKENVLGNRVTKIFPGVKEFGLFKVFQRVWRTGKSEYFPEAVYRDERNPDTWRESWVYKMPSGEIVSIYNDISERRKAKEKINEKVEELEKFYKLAIGRELKMIELKKKIEELKAKLKKQK